MKLQKIILWITLWCFSDAVSKSTTTHVPSVKKVTPFVPAAENNHPKETLLKIRGGAMSPLDPTLTAKVMTFASIVEGAVASVAPAFSNDLYGMKSSPTNNYIMEQLGTGILSFGILAYCLLHQDMSLETSIQISRVPWLLTGLGLFLNKRGSAVGFDDVGPLIVMAENAFMLWAVTQSWGTTALKVYSAFWLVNGLLMILKPKLGGKVWGNDNVQGAALALIRFFGFYLIATNGLIAAMVYFDKNAVTAFGYGWASWLALFVTSLFLSRDVEKLNLAKVPFYVWTVIDAVVVATILL